MRREFLIHPVRQIRFQVSQFQENDKVFVRWTRISKISLNEIDVHQKQISQTLLLKCVAELLLFMGE